LERKPFILVLVDGSIVPQKIDLEFMESLKEEELPFSIVVTKTDKANQKTVSQNMKLLKQQVQKTLGYLPEIILSSSVKKQ
jgi:GTP-binding protein